MLYVGFIIHTKVFFPFFTAFIPEDGPKARKLGTILKYFYVERTLLYDDM
jgi:hypothetical protein